MSRIATGKKSVKKRANLVVPLTHLQRVGREREKAHSNPDLERIYVGGYKRIKGRFLSAQARKIVHFAGVGVLCGVAHREGVSDLDRALAQAAVIAIKKTFGV